ncbi:MAG: GNAT family N-acetyltransferase [Clostridia bacterium]|nr:GNAT family N-acetyltransferase [Clostridia bacterium]
MEEIDFELIDRGKARGTDYIRVNALGEDGGVRSTGRFLFTSAQFASKRVRVMLAASIATPVEFRRGGNVRRMFDLMHSKAADEGCALCLLHPFSFGYYRKFGYERVADHLIARFPTRLIDFADRRCGFVPYLPEMLPEMISVYDAFSKGRNLLLERSTDDFYVSEKYKYRTYLHRTDGVADAYVVFTTENRIDVNHPVDGVLTVREFAFTTPAAAREIFSFLRMFEGEFDTVEFSNCAPAPEIDLLIRHYTHTSYRVLPDIAAKVLNAQILLSSQDYPKKEGAFTLKVESPLPTVGGTWKVEYGGGDCRVSRSPEGPDLELTEPALARLILGCDGVDARIASCMDGVKVNDPDTDFFAAFPKRPCGVFEHF